MSDEKRFRKQLEKVRKVAEEFLVEQFGRRCPDFERNCENCKRWKALDALLKEKLF